MISKQVPINSVVEDLKIVSESAICNLVRIVFKMRMFEYQ